MQFLHLSKESFSVSFSQLFLLDITYLHQFLQCCIFHFLLFLLLLQMFLDFFRKFE